jgi:hypothetical protein
MVHNRQRGDSQWRLSRIASDEEVVPVWAVQSASRWSLLHGEPNSKKNQEAAYTRRLKAGDSDTAAQQGNFYNQRKKHRGRDGELNP